MNNLANRKNSRFNKSKSYFFFFLSFFFYKTNKYDKPLGNKINQQNTNTNQQNEGDVTTVEFGFLTVKDKAVKTRRIHF